jgi:hypothetical protein
MAKGAGQGRLWGLGRGLGKGERLNLNDLVGFAALYCDLFAVDLSGFVIFPKCLGYWG